MSQVKRIHFIAIGGSVMHNLALELQQKGAVVSGSDDEIYEPSASRLKAAGLFPSQTGWFPDSITHDLDAVILGMHARKDNPELLKAQVLGLPVYSYPEYIFRQSADKQRVVIAGSHGKTTITSMILHVLHSFNREFNYLAGARTDGFSQMVKLGAKAPVVIMEGDEYLSSPIDPRPKFLHYHPHIVVISGISWDHFNVFPTFEAYTHAFELLCDSVAKAGVLIYDETDKLLHKIASRKRPDVTTVPYSEHRAGIRNGQTYLKTADRREVPLQVFGSHNLKNIQAALEVCERLGIPQPAFYEAISSFKGASQRLERFAGNDSSVFYRDFAHAPSKVEATTKAVKEQYPGRKLVACAELHTYSSLNKAFLSQYGHKLDAADEAIVFYSPHTLEQKRLPALSEKDFPEAFQRKDLRVFTDPTDLKNYLLRKNWAGTNLLMMSSGLFGGLDLPALGKELLS